MESFKVLQVFRDKSIVKVAYGPITFMCQVVEKDDKRRPLILKPQSIYIDSPDHFEMIKAVRSAWLYNE